MICPKQNCAPLYRNWKFLDDMHSLFYNACKTFQVYGWIILLHGLSWRNAFILNYKAYWIIWISFHYPVIQQLTVKLKFSYIFCFIFNCHFCTNEPNQLSSSSLEALNIWNLDKVARWKWSASYHNTVTLRDKSDTEITECGKVWCNGWNIFIVLL